MNCTVSGGFLRIHVVVLCVDSRISVTAPHALHFCQILFFFTD